MVERSGKHAWIGCKTVSPPNPESKTPSIVNLSIIATVVWHNCLKYGTIEVVEAVKAWSLYDLYALYDFYDLPLCPNPPVFSSVASSPITMAIIWSCKG
jgi:hypothetical protein